MPKGPENKLNPAAELNPQDIYSLCLFFMLSMQILNISSLIPSEWFKPLKDFIISSNQGEGQSIRVNQKPRFERQKKKSHLNVFFSFLIKINEGHSQ